MKLLLPILADIGNGIVATLCIGLIFDLTLSWQFVVGIAFALLPDIDAVPRLVTTGTVSITKPGQRDHRAYVHYPIIFLLLGGLVYVVDPFWGSLFVMATMLHFFNDTWGTGFGIAWLWPLSSRLYKIPVPDWRRHSSIRTLSNDPNKWIDESYLRITPVSVIEYVYFGLSIILLTVYILQH